MDKAKKRLFSLELLVHLDPSEGIAAVTVNM